MQFRLRTLLIVMAIGPPMLAGAWWGWKKIERQRVEWQREQAAIRARLRLQVFVPMRGGFQLVPKYPDPPRADLDFTYSQLFDEFGRAGPGGAELPSPQQADAP